MPISFKRILQPRPHHLHPVLRLRPKFWILTAPLQLMQEHWLFTHRRLRSSTSTTAESSGNGGFTCAEGWKDQTMENRLLLFVAWGRISCPHEAVILCGAIMRFVGETLAPGDSTRRRLVGASGNSNRVLSRSPMVLWEKVRFCVRGIAGVTSSDLAFMAELDGGFGGEAEW
ncbi:hypothetical protein CY34DRAFT_283365 [Suillus luteus UH-Slu-Lm8-n1]|uniref:Uncharacterized protein n=1 Tax=Suillus luteus UH-Slu-Lm8-n1 TaxID=930992 RepID=A0A0C9ZR26_9AGAM|nr:hypothetical protein CY34DRAFT_283365 [Suillus luteus UH-Slu-Lm8-n1]